MSYHDALSAPFMPRLTIDDFLVLDRAGAFDAYAKTELIDGTIVAMNAQYSEHFTVKVRLLRRLADVCDTLDGTLQAWSEGSLAMPPDAVPEPDIFITDTEPTRGLVSVDTVKLVAEVASTTLEQDLGRKRDLYASAGIAEYWVVDVGSRVIHQMWQPLDGAYLQHRQIPFGTSIEAATIPGLRIETDRL